MSYRNTTTKRSKTTLSTQIGVTPHKFATVKALNSFLTAQAKQDTQYFRKVARVGITPDSQILVEIADSPLTIDDKTGNKVLMLAPPFQTCRSWLGIVQQSGRRVLVEAGSPNEFEGFTERVALVRTIANVFASQTDRIVFALGDAVEQGVWYADGGSLIRLTTARMRNIVAIPRGMGNGLVALSVTPSKSATLYRLTANRVKEGEFSAECWEPVCTLDEPITAIKQRFHEQYLIATTESGKLVVLDCSAIKKGNVNEIRRTSDSYQARPAASISPDVGLFVGLNGQAPQAMFAAVDVYGLPIAPARAFQVATAA